MLEDSEFAFRVEIGELRIGLEEVLELSTGSLFRFIAEENSVTLRFGEEKIAEGRFLHSEEGLLLEVTRIFSETNPAEERY